MAPQRKFLDEIDTTTKNFKDKVRVAEKGRPQTSEKNTRYQCMFFEDDKVYRFNSTYILKLNIQFAQIDEST